MNTREKLKKILEKDDTEEGFGEFKSIIDEKYHNSKQLNQQDRSDLSLLLRWAVQQQKKYFHLYYGVLINLGADINFIDTRERKSNLMIACEKTNVEVVEVLVKDKNMKFHLEDTYKKNALYYAIENKNKEKGEKYVRLILDQDPSLLRANNHKNNKTLLISAIEKGRLEVIKLLLDRGADPNQQMCDDGSTPLHEAVKLMKTKYTQNIQQIVQYLLQKGADGYKENKKKKNSVQSAQKYSEQLLAMMEKAKKIRDENKPRLCINSSEERQKIFTAAAAIFKNNECYLQEDKESETSSSYDMTQSDDEPFEGPEYFCNDLSVEIQKFSDECYKDYESAQKQINKFLQDFDEIKNKLNLHVQIYGSFATGLWLKHCDIDLLLCPKQQTHIKRVEQYLDQIHKMLVSTQKYHRITILKNIKVPMIRVQVVDRMKKNTRKIDITILDMNHNGKQHVMYVEQLLHMYNKKLRYLFFVIKKLTHCYKLNDPKNKGIRTYAIILMLALFLQENNSNDNLGDLLLLFLFKFGYNYDYEYILEEEETMILNLPDPVNIKNNVGNSTDVYLLQKMFKTAYIILHSKLKGNKLAYLFESKNMFI